MLYLWNPVGSYRIGEQDLEMEGSWISRYINKMYHITKFQLSNITEGRSLVEKGHWSL